VPGKESQESGSSQDIAINCCGLDPLAIDNVSSSKVDGVHGKLKLPRNGQVRFVPDQQPIVGPFHKTTEIEAVESVRLQI